MRSWCTHVLLALALVAAGCSSSASTEPAEAPAPDTTVAPAIFPGDEWETVDPAAVGLDPGRLDELERSLQERESRCMAVVKDGRLVREAYWDDFTPTRAQEIFSATKSITSTLVGIAEEEGHLDINEPASNFITEWQGTESADVTIRDLLANVSGRFWSLGSDYGDLIRSPDKTGYAIGLTQQHPPGVEWEYNNSAIQALDAVIARSTGVDTAEYARTRLFEPIGMRSTMSKDPSGNTLTFMGAQATCRDLARFGYLLLQQGRWGDAQVVPAEWVAEATTPSSDLNQAYGYLIWLNRPGRIELPTAGERQGPIWPDAPPDAFAALGLGGQTVLVIPSEGVVATRLGPARAGVAAQGNLGNEMARLLVGG